MAIIVWLFSINVLLGEVKADSYKTKSIFFPRETTIHDKSGRKVGTETKSIFFPRESKIRGKSSYDLLYKDTSQKSYKNSYKNKIDYFIDEFYDEDDDDWEDE
ncbi:MAG: hypothetical protein VKL42_05795 [Snowella sp.]|nr:hypothetical protein [Snowella sp.]